MSETNYQFIARYGNDNEALKAYVRAQELVFGNDCDLSVSRIRYMDVPYVVILGEEKYSTAQRIMEPIFKGYPPLASSYSLEEFLPAEIVAELFRRRKMANDIGPWVEGHYRKGV